MAEQSPLKSWVEAERQRTRRRDSAIESLQTIASQFPELVVACADSLRHACSAPPASPNTTHAQSDQPKGRRGRPADNLEKIKAVLEFISDGLTFIDIADRSGLSRSAVRHVCETVFPEQFVWEKSPDDGRAKIWRLKPESESGAEETVPCDVDEELSRLLG